MRENPSDKIQQILRMVIASGYILLAVFVAYKKWLFVPLSDVRAYSFALVLLLYGIYRLYRAKD